MPKTFKVSNRVVVCKEKRQLVLFSQIIAEFPDIKDILMKYETLYLKDVEAQPDNIKNFFKHGQFNKLLETASSEWVASFKESQVDSKNNQIKCSLCNHLNIYIYFIKNKYNGIELNVGSSCIHKFPGIEGLSNFDMRQNKKERQKMLRQIERMKLLNEKYPNALNIIEEHRKFYEQINFILPAKMDERIKNTVYESKRIYNEYINSKIDGTQLLALGSLMAKFEEEKNMVEKYHKENHMIPYFCTPTIKMWLINNKKIATINQIMKDNGFITIFSIKNIYEQNFIKTNFKNRIFKIRRHEFRILEIKNDIKLKRDKDSLEYYISKHDFMMLFGENVFKEEMLIEMTDSMFKNIKLIESENVINTVIDEFNYALRRTRYNFKADTEKNIIEYIDNGKKVYTSGELRRFLITNSYILNYDEDKMKELLIGLYEKICNWKSIDEKDKYKIGNISKATNSEKGKLDLDELKEMLK